MAMNQDDGGASTLRGFGWLFAIVGLGSLAAPYLGIQFRLMKGLEDYQPWAGIGAAVVGVIFLVVARRQSQDA